MKFDLKHEEIGALMEEFREQPEKILWYWDLQHMKKIPSLRKLAEMWGTNHKTVKRFIDRLNRNAHAIYQPNIDGYWDTEGTRPHMRPPLIGGEGVEKVDKTAEYYKKFISVFNKITGKKYRGDRKSKEKFAARLKDGYSGEDFLRAIHAAYNSDFHKEKNYEYLTPEYICRGEILDRYMNFEIPKKPKGEQLA